MSWAEEFYDDNFANFFLDNNSALTEEIEFIKSKIIFKKNMRLLDQGCGTGRLSAQMSDAGFNVTGLDIVESYIEKAKDKHPKIEFICADAETYLTSNKFDIIINWWTSFGYGASKDNDLNVLKSTYDNLEEGGVYILDLLNAEQCRNDYSSDSKVEYEEHIDGTKFVWENWLSDDNKKIIKKWSFEKADGKRISKTGGGIWLYDAKEIKEMLMESGFESVEFYGDMSSIPLQSDDNRCIVVARKSKFNFRILPKMPDDNKEFRSSIYNGDLYKLPSTSISKALASELQDQLNKIFKGEALYLQNIATDNRSYDKLAPLKLELKDNPVYWIIIKELLIELGLNPSEYVVDYFRLRANIPNEHKNKDTQIAYTAHRDTWYSNPQSQINFWIPIYDCTDKNSMAFFPDYFDKAVENNSKDFEYDKWTEVGYVETLNDLSNPIAFNYDSGEILAFSAAHLHQGLSHSEGKTRYSIDFRIVHIADDKEGIGAPNVDNSSHPYAIDDYRGYK